MQPTVRDDGDVIVWRNRLEHGHRQCNIMLVLGVSLTQNEVVMEQNDLTVNVFDEDEEIFCCAVDLLVPSEIGNDREIDAKQKAGDGLNLRLQSIPFGYRPQRDRFQMKTYWSLGKLCTRRCTSRPALGIPISSPISGGVKSK